MNINGKSSIALGEARGVAIAALISRRVPIIEISALQIKKSVTGLGRATKQQVAQMLPLILDDMPSAIRVDASDALACAVAATPSLQMQFSRMPKRRKRYRARAR